MNNYKSFLKHVVLTIILIFSIGLVQGCTFEEDKYSYEYEVNYDERIADKFYVYEIHTISGICDTVKVRRQLVVYTSDAGAYTRIDEIGVKYYYIDRITRLPDEYKMK